MKNLILTLTTATALIAGGFHASAATVYDNGDPANSYISTPDNWDNGLPGAGNDGTIAIAASIDSTVTHSNYGNVTHSAGLLSRTNGSAGFLIGAGTFWLMNGTATASGPRGINVSAGGSFTLDLDNNAAVADFSDNNRDVNSSGTLTIDSGNLLTGRSATARDGSIIMNGGSITFSTAGNFGSQALSGVGTAITVNAGNVTAERFSLRNGTAVTFGSAGAGLLDFDDWGSGLYTGTGDRAQDNGIDMNFLSGSEITLDLSASARALNFSGSAAGPIYGTAWAQALWETDRLKFHGQTSTDLGGLSWADASNSSVGFGGGEYFDWTAAGTYGGALSLGVVPEPGTWALVTAGLTAIVLLRRRRRSV